MYLLLEALLGLFSEFWSNFRVTNFCKSWFLDEERHILLTFFSYMYIENFVYLEEGETIIEVFRNLTKYVIRENTGKYEP